MHKRGSFYDIVSTPHCQIVHPDFCRILETAREYFAGLEAPFYKKLSHKGYLRHLLVRRAVKTGEILVALVTTTQKEWLEGAGPCETDAPAQGVPEARESRKAGAEPAYLKLCIRDRITTGRRCRFYTAPTISRIRTR